MTEKRKFVCAFDVVLACLLVLVAAVPFFVAFDDSPVCAVIEVEGREVAKYSLSEQKNGAPLTVAVPTREGEVTVEIGEDYAVIKDSPCPAHTCIKNGPVTRSGQTVICLPCRLTVRITGEAEYDGITG